MSTQKFTLGFLLIFLLGQSPLSAQFKEIKGSEYSGEKIELKPLFIPNSNENGNQESFDFTNFSPLDIANSKHSIFPISYDGESGIAFRGYTIDQLGLSIEDQVQIYLDKIVEINDLRGELQYIVTNITIDDLGMVHVSVQQTVNGVDIDGAMIKLHAKNDVINYANGRLFEVPSVNTVATLTSSEALNIVYDSYREQGIFKEISEAQKILVPSETEQVELIVKENRLMYRVKAYANVQQAFTYYIDAQSGDVIDSFKNFCSLHHNHAEHENKSEMMDGPATANALDLSNTSRLINTYDVDGTFYMVDASREMFNASSSNMPNEPVGVIWTIDGQNTNPQNNDFDYDHVKSTDNTWASKIAVSAHYNGGQAYEYFRETHNRNSINADGGNIISLINISDPETGGGYDNAFWNGAALFYGNGNQAFTPLAEGLDVAGHEMSHGVVQATANLTYQGESGALNEAFADIFGAMIDRDDWLIGEEIVKTSAFPSGAMRSMIDPHNGGSSLSDPGYQPKNVSEQFTGTADNGGVHINSGIVNHAYYLFATTDGVGKDRAEKVFYRALTTYLSASSNFKDMRAAAEKAAEDLYDQTVVSAVSAAFSSVGIGEGGGSTDYEEDVEMNPGEDFLLSSLSNLSEVLLRNNSLELISDPLIDVAHISKPSVTDNGETIFFVGEDKNIYVISIDWDTGNVSGDVFDDQGVWRNVVVSKDGKKIAFITDELTNDISIFDFDSGIQEWFTLYNPTFSQDGTTTGDVDFADAMEFDFTGEYLMYDAQNTIDGGSNGSISYWDIGFLNVGDGQIQKLFNQLPENTSVGNPTFSKNSPYIIAFDLIESNGYSVMGANIESNEVNQIYDNGKLGYPNFNNADNQLVYESSGFFGNSISLSALEDNKITAVYGTHTELIDNERLPVVFSNGERTISNNKEDEFKIEVTISPNPASEMVIIESSEVIEEIKMYSTDGRLVHSTNINGKKIQIDIKDLNSGIYNSIIRSESGEVVKQIIKQ